ncbi:transcription elongation factor GreA [Treponema sp.]|uniref:transcription elongation factor GreA n=1 Tax=Treponema sp. TaxID=166 RepID=UPI003F0C83E3
MSEELENSVREMLKAETWTRAGITNFTKNNIEELEKILEECKSQNCEYSIKDLCDEQLSHTKDSIVALYLSGMIAMRTGSVDTSSLYALFEIFEKNHKESLVEYLCTSILEEDPQNKLALRKLAEYYKNSNDDRIWELYEKIVKLDFEEAEMARILAERYNSQGNREVAVNYYKKALLRFVSAKNIGSAKSVWSILVSYIPEELDFFMLVQRKVAKTISEDKSATLMQELYKYYKETSKWDTAITILKLILEIDSKDSWARKEITECFRGKYADHSHLEDYIKSSNLEQSFRNVFEAISDFEKHIAFDAKNYVFHRTWGVGIITKVEGDILTINFGKKTGVHTMSLKMAVSALQPLAKDHIKVYKKTVKHEELVKKVKSDIPWTLKTIIKSYNNNCDEKHIKAELVPSILKDQSVSKDGKTKSSSEWTSWHSKAQKILSEDPSFGVNPNDVNFYTVRDRELSKSERLANEFKANKEFFPRIDIISRYLDAIEDPSDEQFSDMFSYFANYLKAFSSVNEQTVASYLVVQEIVKRISALENPAKFTFSQLYSEIENPSEMYTKLKDTKNTHLKKMFLANIKMLQDWDSQYIRLFPTVLDKNIIAEIISADKKEKAVHLVQDIFNDYRNNRNAAIYLIAECKSEDWFTEAGISEEKQLVTLVNIISVCCREKNNHVNTVENTKTIKAATALLFGGKLNEDKNAMLSYMLANSTDVITRMYTMVSDLTDLEPKYKAALRNGILGKYPDFKFQEAEIKQETPKGLLVTAKMLDVKRALVEDIEKTQLPKIAEEIAEAKAKGDLKENAEYHAAIEAQSRLNAQLSKLKEELARAVVFDPSTATTSIVSFGTKVTFENHLENKDNVYTILGPWESNVDEGIISYLSPLGNNLLDMKKGERRTFTINEHKYDFTVKSIEAAGV